MSVQSATESLVQCEWPSRPLVKILNQFEGLLDPEKEEDATEKFLRSEAQSVLDYLKLTKIYKLGEVSLAQIDRRTSSGRLFKAKTPCIALVPKGHSGCFLYRWGCVAEDCICLPEDHHSIAFLQTRSELWSKKPTEIVLISLEAIQLYKMEQFTACEGCVVWKGMYVEEVIEKDTKEISNYLSGPIDVQTIAESKLLNILDSKRGNKLFEEKISLNDGKLIIPCTSAFRYLVLDIPLGRKLKIIISHAEYIDQKYRHECELNRGDIIIMDDTSGQWNITYQSDPHGSWILYHPEGVGLENPELSRRSMIGTGMSESRCIPYNVPKTAFKPNASLTLMKHSVKTALLEHKRTAPWMRSAELQTPLEITETKVATIKTAQFDPTIFAFISGEGSAVISEEGNGTRLVPIQNLVGSIWWLWPQSTAHLTSSNGAPLRFIIFPAKFKPLKIMPETLPEPWGVTICKRVASPLHLANVPDCEEIQEEGDVQVSLMPALVCMLEGAPVDPAAFHWRVAIDESGPIANDQVILIPLKLTEKEPGEEPPQGWTSLDVAFAPAEAKVGGRSVRVGDIVFTEGRHVYLLEGTWLVGEGTDILDGEAVGEQQVEDEEQEVAQEETEEIGQVLSDGEVAEQPVVEEELPAEQLELLEDPEPMPTLNPVPGDLTQGSPRKKRRLLTEEDQAYPMP